MSNNNKNTTPTFVVKTVFKDAIRRFNLGTETPSFHVLEQHVRKAYQEQLGSSDVTLSFNYQDDEGDICIVSSDAELIEAFAIESNQVLKVFVQAAKKKTKKAPKTAPKTTMTTPPVVTAVKFPVVVGKN